MKSRPAFRELAPAERRAILEKLATTLHRNAGWARQEGDDALEMVMGSVGTALLSAAEDLAKADLVLAEDAVRSAVNLIATFHCRHPKYPIEPMVH
ncbi:hypothetical protein [Rhizobium grahamii]|uniref:hypothetical protein n=1 Tax=Rhizobium grahamii TaxID=1120045 RepID=UPI00059511A1|nr:hypothetical protein [Rhizobium grahamii]